MPRAGNGGRGIHAEAVSPRGAIASVASMMLLYLCLASVLLLGAFLASSALWAYGAVAVFTAFCVHLLSVSPVTFLLFVPLLALRLTEFLSGAAIESGAYMTETAAHGYPTGAFTRLLIVYILFFGLAAMVTEARWPSLRRVMAEAPRRWERQARPMFLTIVAVVALFTVYLALLGISNGVPLLQGIDRFVYLQRVDSPGYTFFIRNRIVIVPFIGILFALPRYRRRAGLLLLWLVGTSVLFGEKFTSLLQIFSVFAVPAGLAHVARGGIVPVRTVASIAMLIVLVTVPAVLVAYGALDDLDTAVQRYSDRAALQGQLWFRTDERYWAAFRYDPAAIEADVLTWLNPAAQDSTAVGTRFGLYYVMEKFTPEPLLGWAMNSGNGFVFSLYPYLLIVIGAVGMIVVSSIIAIYHGWLMHLLAQSLARASWLASFAFGRVMASFYGAYSTGYLWNLFGIKTLFTLAVGLFLLWATQSRDSASGSLLTRAAQRLPRAPTG